MLGMVKVQMGYSWDISSLKEETGSKGGGWHPESDPTGLAYEATGHP